VLLQFAVMELFWVSCFADTASCEIISHNQVNCVALVAGSALLGFSS